MWKTELDIEGSPAVYQNRVSEDYFDTLGMTVLAGRDFDVRDSSASPHVAVINQALARKYFGDKNPIGRRYRPRDGNRLGDPIEIVGIVTDARYGGLREPVPPTVYTPLAQAPTIPPRTNLEIRVSGRPPAALVADVKAVIAAIDTGISLEFTTLSAQVDRSLDRERLLALLSALFGGLALLLAGMGLYGVIACDVARRRSEIGIRMALGARPSGILKMMLLETAALLVMGLAAGLIAAMATTRLLTKFLYGLSANDPATIVAAALVIAAAAFGAGYIPARRAANLDPMSALRAD
jgi:predicted permease